MKVGEAMRYYQMTLNYFKQPIIDFIQSQPYILTDQKNVTNLYYGFIEMCSFEELFVPMLEKEKPEVVVKRLIDKYNKRWQFIVDWVCKR